MDVPPVLLGHDRAEEGRDACARIPQAPAHVLLPVARMGDGRAQEGVDAGMFLVKSVFRVSSLIFFGFRHEECRPVVCFTGCPSCRT